MLQFIIIYIIYLILYYLVYTTYAINSSICLQFNYYCVAKRVKYNSIIYSVITASVIFDAINFHINFILKHHIFNHYYIALDEESFYFMKNYTSNIFLYSLNLTNSNPADYGTNNYGKIVLSKTKINYILLNLKKYILLTDIDIYFYSNPFSNLISYNEDLIISKDGYSSVNTGL